MAVPDAHFGTAFLYLSLPVSCYQPMKRTLYFLLLMTTLLPASCTPEYNRIKAIEAVKEQGTVPPPEESNSTAYTHSSPYPVVPIARRQRSGPPKNVIVMIGDGMGPAQVAGGMIANRGQLYLQQAEYTGLSITQNGYGEITDSAAGATAMATGVKTYNKAIAVDSSGHALRTIMMEAHEHGLVTGMVVGCEVVDATPASFVLNHPDRNEGEAIALKYLDAPLDFLYGGGRKYFDHREDQRNLLEDWEKKGVRVVTHPNELEKIHQGKVVALLTKNGPPPVAERTEAFMQQGLSKALELLSRNERGFVLMVEGSQIDDAGHFNNTAYHVQEVLDFDKLVGKALQFAAQDEETLVVITADHETGGFTIVAEDTQSGTVEGRFASGDHTAVFVPVFAFGPGSERFSGFYQNNDIYHRITRALRWQETY